IEEDESRKRRETLQEVRKGRNFPGVLDVRDPARHQDEVVRTVALHLIRDVDVAALRVLRHRCGRHGSTSAGSARYSFTQCASEQCAARGRADDVRLSLNRTARRREVRISLSGMNAKPEVCCKKGIVSVALNLPQECTGRKSPMRQRFAFSCLLFA